MSNLRPSVLQLAATADPELCFIKLPDGMTARQYLEEVRGGTAFPEGALDYSGPGLTSPGERIEVWLELDPGD